jgi:hypothetical protein
MYDVCVDIPRNLEVYPESLQGGVCVAELRGNRVTFDTQTPVCGTALIFSQLCGCAGPVECSDRYISMLCKNFGKLVHMDASATVNVRRIFAAQQIDG